MRFLSTTLLLVGIGGLVGQEPKKNPDPPTKETPKGPERWEKEIAGIEKRLAEKPPAAGGVVFAGSSSIRLWKLDASFPDWSAVNCGFGGSEIRDTTHFIDRLILKHKPATVVFYAGENDVARNRPPKEVAGDFEVFVAKVHKDLPKTRILFISLKPSPSRWKMFDRQTETNALVKQICAKDDRLTFVDIVPLMRGKDGQPRSELFVDDKLHMNAGGYAIWAAEIKNALKK